MCYATDGSVGFCQKSSDFSVIKWEFSHIWNILKYWEIWRKLKVLVLVTSLNMLPETCEKWLYSSLWDHCYGCYFAKIGKEFIGRKLVWWNKVLDLNSYLECCVRSYDLSKFWNSNTILAEFRVHIVAT